MYENPISEPRRLRYAEIYADLAVQLTALLASTLGKQNIIMGEPRTRTTETRQRDSHVVQTSSTLRRHIRDTALEASAITER